MPPFQFQKIHLILSSHLRLVFQVVYFPQVSPPKPCIHLFCQLHVQNSLPVSLQSTSKSRRKLWTFRNMHIFCGEELLAPPPTSMLEDDLLSVVCDYLLDIFPPLSILEAVPPSANWGRAEPWWQGPTHHGFNPLNAELNPIRHLLALLSTLAG